jgi:hypothetical protein
MDSLTDEIESVLFICREVMGKCYRFQLSADASLPGTSAHVRVGIQSCRVGRPKVPLERSSACDRDRAAVRHSPGGEIIKRLC